jgi:predicted glycoside hydrolase/deacetylase ChbG (UPF0249 family)
MRGKRRVLIINADDWGGWQSATDAALACFHRQRISSVTAMVFMADSERAAQLAAGLNLAVGLHLNLNLPFTGNCPEDLRRQHHRVCRWLGINKFAQLVYNPFLRDAFRAVYEAQVREFVRLYSRTPSHIDGHQHMHLSANMLLSRLIPAGQKLRRSFSFWPGEKSFLNRTYRRSIDRWIGRRYRLTHYFFSLSQCLRMNHISRVGELARSWDVELMAHPEKRDESEWLMSDGYVTLVRGLRTGSYALL